MEKSPHRDVQALACLRSAQFLDGRLKRLDLVKEQPDMAKRYEGLFGKDYLDGLLRQHRPKAVKEVEGARGDGVHSVLLFGLPDRKDDIGSAAYDPEAPVQCAVRAIKREVPDALVVTDVCLCEYTDHGHCGVIIERNISRGEVVIDNGVCTFKA